MVIGFVRIYYFANGKVTYLFLILCVKFHPIRIGFRAPWGNDAKATLVLRLKKLKIGMT